MKKIIGIIVCCCACSMLFLSCNKKDEAYSKDISGYVFKMNDVKVQFHSKESGKDNSYNVTVSTDYGSTATAERATASAYWDWNSSKQASLQLNFEIGNKETHKFQRENYNLTLTFDGESAGKAVGKDSYTRVWRNWSTPEYNGSTDVLYGNETVDAQFTLTK